MSENTGDDVTPTDAELAEEAARINAAPATVSYGVAGDAAKMDRLQRQARTLLLALGGFMAVMWGISMIQMLMQLPYLPDFLRAEAIETVLIDGIFVVVGIAMVRIAFAVRRGRHWAVITGMVILSPLALMAGFMVYAMARAALDGMTTWIGAVIGGILLTLTLFGITWLARILARR